MIGRIRGVLIDKQAPELLVDVQGVAYELQAPMSTFYQLPAIGEEVVLHTHFVVREDAQQLFGFHDLQERVLFRALIRVSGVGPKVALAILSGMSADDFVRTVRVNDTAAMVKVPGIGKKTAERLVVEMRDRLADWHDMGAGDAAALAGGARGAQSMDEDAETALVALGYKPQEAARMIAAARKEDATLSGSEELIRLALKSRG